ncbi:MAG: PAS domain-containing sensor histidine kinase [Bacteroidales bacterium]|nr:PAS domain-containing sensor histidine kinase [Bacteroidales bacterium]
MTDTLIISDDSDKASILGKMMEGITSVSYCGVDESASKITEGSYGIVVIYLPLTENIDRVLQLIVFAKTQSSVIITGTLDETDLVYRCFDNGATEVLITPFSEGLVKLRVTGVIKKRIASLQTTANELKAERSKYRMLFENMNSGFTLFKVKDNKIYLENANSKVLESFPKARGVTFGSDLGVTLPKFYQAFAEDVFKVNNTGESLRYEKNFDLINRYMSFNFYRPEPGYVAMLAQDLTEKRLAEKRTVELSYQIKKQFKDLDNKAYELDKAKKQLELFLEGSNDGTWDFDVANKRLSVNLQYRRQLGYEDDETAFTSPDDFVNIICDQENKEKFQMFYDSVRDGKIDMINEELKVRCKDGSVKWLMVKCVVKRDENGRAIRVAGVNTDISERKAYEETLNHKSEELQKANDTKNMFISIIAHDLRNPFNAIIGLTDILRKREAVINDPKANELSGVILQSAKTTYDMLNNLLLWCRSQQNTIAFEPEELNLHYTVDEALSEVKGQAQKKHIMLINRTSTSDTIWADAQMLQTVIRNITVNSVKYTNEGGLITVAAEWTPEGIDVIIEDNGIGMSQETVDKLLVVSRNRSTVGTAGEQGSGMGLLICKEFISRHNGKIKIESEVGKGTKFIITFPHNG